MLGFSSLREIRGMNCYYVDKTDHARRLVERGKHYFLSRPRRFGKTLLVDTLQELFEGSEELGPRRARWWDWSARRRSASAEAISSSRTGCTGTR